MCGVNIKYLNAFKSIVLSNKFKLLRMHGLSFKLIAGYIANYTILSVYIAIYTAIYLSV